GLEFPLIRFKQISRITNYRVNVTLPDSLYATYSLFTIDQATINSDSLFAGSLEVVPLSSAEEEAYATIDSTATLEEAFKPTGFLARLADDEDDNSGGFEFFEFTSHIPGSLTPNLRFNR